MYRDTKQKGTKAQALNKTPNKNKNLGLEPANKVANLEKMSSSSIGRGS